VSSSAGPSPRGGLALAVAGIVLVSGLSMLPASAAPSPIAPVPRDSPGPDPSAVAHPSGPAPAAATPALDVSASGSVNWPTYMGSDERTAANLLERTIAPSNVSRLEEVWNISTNGSARSAPIVVNGSVYWGAWNGYEYASNASTGTLEWSEDLGSDPDCYVHGIESTPADSNGTLYLGAPNGSWDALNASTGNLEASYYTGGSPAAGYYDWSSGLVFHHALYIGLSSCDDQPLIPGGVEEVNVSGNFTANHTWLAVSGGPVGSSVWTSPTADPATNTVWVTTGNDNGVHQPYAQSVVGLNATTLAVEGSWQVPDVVGIDSDFGTTPTLVTPAGASPLVIATNKNGETYALDPDNVTSADWGPVWTLPTGGGWSGAAFNGTTVFVAGGSVANGTVEIYAVRPETGTVEWQAALPPGGYPFASLDYADGLLFVGGGNQERALDATNGTVLWNYSVPADEAIDGEAVVADGHLYVPSGTTNGTAGHLYAFALPFGASANVSGPNGSAPWSATFSAAATGGMTPYSFDWTFDDGGTSSAGTVSHIFERAGAHWGHVDVRDSAGDSFPFNLSATTTVAGPPFGTRIGTSAATGEAPFAVTFTALPSNGSGPPYVDHWTFGDGTDGSGGAPVHVYEAAGTYPVHLEQVGPLGETANASTTVQVLPSFSGSLVETTSAGTAPLTVNFTLSLGGGSPPYAIAWNFGDGGSAAGGTSPSHTYVGVGNFTAEANVSDALTGHLQFTTLITTYAPPFVVNVTSTDEGYSCATGQDAVRFVASTSGGSAPIVFGWEFGDGSPGASGPRVVHNFTGGEGPWLVNTTATDATGNVTSAQTLVPPAAVGCGGTVAPQNTAPVAFADAFVGLVVAVFVILAVLKVLSTRRKRRDERGDAPPTPPGP
jgi:outer membrane protein assembly factor BamB